MRTAHCDYCGDTIDVRERYGNELVTCGKRECERWARNQEMAEREEAHEQLDRDMGWDR